MLVARPRLLRALRNRVKANPVVALLGPRQCGKTTLAAALTGTGAAIRYDLEDPADLARLAEPVLALERLRGLSVLPAPL